MQGTKSNLEGEQVQIRKLRLFDVRDVFINLRDKETNRRSLRPAQPYPENTLRRIFRRGLRLIRRTLQFIWQMLCPSKVKKEFKLGVVFKETGRVIGVITLAKVDRQNRSAEIGFWIGKKYWGRGLTSEAVRLALKYGFEELELHRIYAWTFEKHIASRRVMEKSGFKLEGVMREAVLKDNERHNILNYGILKP